MFCQRPAGDMLLTRQECCNLVRPSQLMQVLASIKLSVASHGAAGSSERKRDSSSYLFVQPVPAHCSCALQGIV